MWTCKKCNKAFQSRLLVLKHLRIHSKYRPYKCHFGNCIKSFSTLSGLQRHRRHHSDLRSYQCRVCGLAFLLRSHLTRHKCKNRRNQRYRCHLCSVAFPQILSLATHVHAQHPQRYSRFRNKSRDVFKRLKKSKIPASDDNKILLKIKAGKSMTIISPTKTPPCDREKRHAKKKSKKKHRKEEKEVQRTPIILSFKKGTVNVSDKKTSEKSATEKLSVRLNGLTKPEYKLSEQKSELKLTIKTCPDLTHLVSSKEVYKLSEKVDSPCTSSHVSVKKAHSLTDIDQMVKSGQETSSIPGPDETKARNGIVITKDKSGKFKTSKLKKRDRDNVFDSFGDVGLWKVMPSPRTDRPVDVLKLKLSPHKPIVRLDSTEDTCSYNASKYLDIPINVTPKVKSDASGEDSDIMVSSPAFDKESDGGINNVNDSGIEVLSSSSCNRSNGNSVRSVALEDNSPTYFNAEDSLLSLDSPYTDTLNKSEHSICHKCGGIILETNNNTRSPGKCRCNFSNPNSPLKNSVSPLKSSAQSSDTVKSQDSVFSLAHKSLASLDSIEKGNQDTSVPTASLTASKKNDIGDSEVMIINPDVSVSNTDKKTRLKLKLRMKDDSPSVKAGKTSQQKTKLSKTSSYGFVPKEEKVSKESNKDLKVESVEVQKVKKKLYESSSEKVQSPSKECKNQKHNDSNGLNLNRQKVSEVNITDNDVDMKNCDSKQSVPVPPTSSTNLNKDNTKNVRKKPLFKCKKQQNKSESQSENMLKQLTEKPAKDTCDKPFAKLNTNKKPLFKKRTISMDEKIEMPTQEPKIPLVKKQVSEPATSSKHEITDISKVLESDVKKQNNVKNEDSLNPQSNEVLVHEKSVKEMSVDKESVNELPVKEKLQIDKKSVNEFPVKEKSVKEVPAKEKSVKNIPVNKKSMNKVPAKEISIQDLPVKHKKSVKGLSLAKVDDGEDDSLQKFPDVPVDPPEEIPKPASTPLDLFQQQFLSFLSNSISSSKNDASKDPDCSSLGDSESVSSENVEENKDAGSQDRSESIKISENVAEIKSSNVKSSSQNTEKQSTKHKSVENRDKSSNDSNVTDKKAVKTTNKDAKNCAKPTPSKEKVDSLNESGEKLTRLKESKEKVEKSKSSVEKVEKSKLSKHTVVNKTKKSKENEKLKGSNEKVDNLKVLKENNDKVIASNENVKLKALKSKVDKSKESSREKVDNKEKVDSATKSSSKIPKTNTDSFSWLKIFSSTEQNKSSPLLNSEISKDDVMTDLSENLAEINKKMVVSEDDDSNSLDVDDVFSLGHLSSLEPKTNFNFNMDQVSEDKICTSHEADVCRKRKKFTRKQTAKRTIGRFKTKRKIESESGSDVNLYDNPDSDSDYDYISDKRRHSIPKECLRQKQGHMFDSSDSENDSYIASDDEPLESDTHSSRSRRPKKNRHCPCCVGSPLKKKRHSSHTHVHSKTYKLPKQGKLFVRYTLRLLELQEKVHTLFLTLFPECADLIMCSKVGTDDFELLIDEVVASLEKSPQPTNPALQNGENKVDSMIVGTQFSTCAMNNIGMPFTTPDSISRSCEIDLVNINGDEKDQHHISANISKTDGVNVYNNLSATVVDEANLSSENSGKTFDTGTLWQHPTLLAQSTRSSSSLKFENNTLNDSDNDQVVNEETSVDDVSLSASYNCPSVTQVVDSQDSSPDMLANSFDSNKTIQMFNNEGMPLDSNEQPFSELQNNIQYFTPIEPMPTVQNEITITLDLNAVRVSLCRKPKDCLQRFHSQLIKLLKCLLPKLSFKNYFYRNIDNLEFLLDMMLEANMNTPPVESEDDMEFSEPEEVPKWHDIIQSKLDMLEPSLIQESDTVQVNIFSSETNSKSEEKESLFVKCSDLFEQQIKSQRESLKKDVFSVEEEQIENDWKSAQEVLDSITSMNKMAERVQRSRGRPRRRDSRLRKRSADEKRTLFVQEKLQNSQNSTFVCDKPVRTRPNGKSKAGRKRIRRESSKEKFLSGLNLGDNQDDDDFEEEPYIPMSRRKRLKLLAAANPLTIHENEQLNTGDTLAVEQLQNGETHVTDTKGEKGPPQLEPLNIDHTLKVETESGLISPDKNIFELMQPS